MHDFISPTHDIHRGYTPTRRSVPSDGLPAVPILHLGQGHAQDFPRLSQTPSNAPQGGIRSRFAAVPGISQLYTVNGDFGRKMTYCPDEPRGWTPRLTIYDNELAYSCNTKVASSYNTVILVEDDTLVDQQSRSRRGGESRCEIHLILELLDWITLLPKSNLTKIVGLPK